MSKPGAVPAADLPDSRATATSLGDAESIDLFAGVRNLFQAQGPALDVNHAQVDDRDRESIPRPAYGSPGSGGVLLGGLR